ncbi:MAG: F0F1 ATP synthase subunit B [Bacillota bacterium]|nr:F0F1 ATP synthase subunit B [Bacillota bacterium]
MFTPEAIASYLSAAIVTVINLLAAYFILKHFLFRPILKMLRKRRLMITDELKQAEEKLSQAEDKMNQAEAKLDASTHEAAEILNEARSQADRQSEAILGEARRNAAGLITRAETEVNRMRITMLNDVRNEVADLAVAIASKVIGQAMDSHRQHELVDQFLEESMAKKKGTDNDAKEVPDHE